MASRLVLPRADARVCMCQSIFVSLWEFWEVGSYVLEWGGGSGGLEHGPVCLVVTLSPSEALAAQGCQEHRPSEAE